MDDIINTPEFKMGREAEGLLIEWMRRRYYVISIRDYNGTDLTLVPTTRSADDSIVLPDLLCSSGGESWWVECKAKSDPLCWHKEGGVLYHGIERRLLNHYVRIKAITGLRVDLVILEAGEVFLYLRDLVSAKGKILGTGRMESGKSLGTAMINYRRDMFEVLTILE